MSRVLKLHGKADAPTIQSLRSAWSTAQDDTVSPPPAPVVDPELLHLREEQGRLRNRLEQQEVELASLRQQVEAAFKKGETQGREAGIREAADQSAKMLAGLERGMERAVATFSQAVSGLERLAPLLASQGIATILGQADDRRALVTAVVLRQLQSIEAQSVVHIEVSQADFPDDLALASLGDVLASVGTKVHAVAALKSGDCRIKLTLGTLEVGLDQQWRRLNAMLEDLAEPTGAPHA